MAGSESRWRSQSPWVLLVCVLIAADLHFDLLWLSDTANDYFSKSDTALDENRPSEVEVTWESMPDPVTDESDPRQDQPSQEVSPNPDPPEPTEEVKEEPPVAKVEKIEEESPQLPEQPRAMLQSIEQKSDDPAVAAPEEPRFLAEESRRVEEETVAKVRSYDEDDPNPVAAGSGAAEPDGNAQETEVADARDEEGADDKTPEKQEKLAQSEVAEPDRGAPQPAVTPSKPASGQVLALEGGEPIAVPPASEARKGSAGPDQRLQLSWSGFRGAVGEKTLKEERHAYLRRKKSRIRGSNREKTFREFRAAIENFVPNVKTGEQTALNAAASPFASYIAAIHRRIHREFADDFLRGLPGGSLSPYSDESLLTKLEIILNADGTVHKIGVVRTSGLLPFDYGAYAAVTRAAPFPTAPDSIRSGDGRVYLHWGFYRNQRQCGTFNAEPYILPNLGREKGPRTPVDSAPPSLVPGSKHTKRQLSQPHRHHFAQRAPSEQGY